jgi:hypothetical protein
MDFITRGFLLLLAAWVMCGCHTKVAATDRPIDKETHTVKIPPDIFREEMDYHPAVEIARVSNVTAVVEGKITTAKEDATNRQPHGVNLGNGSKLLILHPANSTPVHVAFARWEQAYDGSTNAVFRVTNSDACWIMVWNFRVEVWWDGKDSPGWRTLWSNYPAGQFRHPPGAVAEFKVSPPDPDSSRWRTAIIYSKEQVGEIPPKGTERVFADDFEVISEELRE